jgi:serine/threonine protein kinase
MTSPFELPGFEPVRRIGGGGFGDVWLSTQTSIDREVAIKVGHAPLQDDTVKIRFDRECKALGRLSGHPNIVGVFTAGTLEDGRPYLVLEYIDGGTLWQRLKRAPLTDGELINIGRELSAALDAAHSAGVLHRDLKPENILVRSTGGAVLGDFGIARLQDGANTTSASITASVAYAAPEVLSGKKATISTDLYGIGVCLLAAAIRAVPFVEKSDESIQPILKRVLSDRHPDLTEHGVSAELAELLDSLLQKNPSKRPQHASEVLAQFSALHARISGTVPILPYELAAPRPAPSSDAAEIDPTEDLGGLDGADTVPPLDLDAEEDSEVDNEADSSETTGSEQGSSGDHDADGLDADDADSAGDQDDETVGADAGGLASKDVPDPDPAPDADPDLDTDPDRNADPSPDAEPDLGADSVPEVDLDADPVARPVPELDDEQPVDPSADIRMFFIAYTSTVVIGGLLLALFLFL